MEFIGVRSWASPWCAVHYLAASSLVTWLAQRKQHPPGFAVTLAVLAGGAVGYLYEVPYWLRIDGLDGLFRTAARSWSVVDWGFLSVFLFLWMVESAGVEWRRPEVAAGAGLYAVYVASNLSFRRLAWFLQGCTPFPSSLYYRTIVYLAILPILVNLRPSKFTWVSRPTASPRLQAAPQPSRRGETRL